MDTPTRVQVIGGGSWGLALADLLARNGCAVRLWCRAEDDPEHLRATRQSRYYLPHFMLAPEVMVEETFDSTVDIAVFAVPSHAMRWAATEFPFAAHTLRVNVAKGIERGTLKRMSEILEEAGSGGAVATLSGPSHAEEVAQGLPASVVVASADHEAAAVVQRVFFRDTFRVYTSADIVGVELGGALKNVIAIAAGVCDGLGLGDNAKAALVTRGLAEITRVAVACGGNPLTLAGLSGMGDMIVTCFSRHSRNRRLGEMIAQGHPWQEVTASTHMVAEGVSTAAAAHDLANKAGVEMPISEAVYRVLHEGVSPGAALASLLSREAKPEQYGFAGAV